MPLAGYHIRNCPGFNVKNPKQTKLFKAVYARLEQKYLTAGLGNLAQAFRGRCGADGEIESSTGIGRGFGPDFAMMAAQNSLRDGQTCTGAFKLFWRVQSLKHAKKSVGIFQDRKSVV